MASDLAPGIRGELITRCAAALTALVGTMSNGKQRSQVPQVFPYSSEECYLSVQELSKRIPYADQTIRNMMAAGTLREGKHYFRWRGKPCFKWSAVAAEIEGQLKKEPRPLPLVRSVHKRASNGP